VSIEDLRSAVEWLGAYEVNIDEHHSTEIASATPEVVANTDDPNAAELLRVRAWLLAEIASRREDAEVRKVVSLCAAQGRRVSTAKARAAYRRQVAAQREGMG
jgi:hypothetical protein